MRSHVAECHSEQARPQAGRSRRISITIAAVTAVPVPLGASSSGTPQGGDRSSSALLRSKRDARLWMPFRDGGFAVTAASVQKILRLRCAPLRMTAKALSVTAYYARSGAKRQRFHAGTPRDPLSRKPWPGPSVVFALTIPQIRRFVKREFSKTELFSAASRTGARHHHQRSFFLFC